MIEQNFSIQLADVITLKPIVFREFWHKQTETVRNRYKLTITKQKDRNGQKGQKKKDTDQKGQKQTKMEK